MHCRKSSLSNVPGKSCTVLQLLWFETTAKPVKLCKLSEGKVTFSRNILVENIAKSQVFQSAGKSDVLQALVETIAKSQSLQTVGQSDVLQALVEKHDAKSQAFANCRAK